MSDQNQTTKAAAMRRRLAEIIERQDRERGRPLTVQEQLANLQAALDEDIDTPCPFCGVRDPDPCGYFVAGERCKLEPLAVEMLKETPEVWLRTVDPSSRK